MDMPDTSATDGPETQPIKRFKFVEENELDEIVKARTEATTNKQTVWGVKLFRGTPNVPSYHDIRLSIMILKRNKRLDIGLMFMMRHNITNRMNKNSRGIN